MLRYRAFKEEAARENALFFTDRGLNYPWESAWTGNEVTPDRCVNCKKYGMHVRFVTSEPAYLLYPKLEPQLLPLYLIVNLLTPTISEAKTLSTTTTP